MTLNEGVDPPQVGHVKSGSRDLGSVLENIEIILKQLKSEIKQLIDFHPNIELPESDRCNDDIKWKLSPRAK